MKYPDEKYRNWASTYAAAGYDESQRPSSSRFPAEIACLLDTGPARFGPTEARTVRTDVFECTSTTPGEMMANNESDNRQDPSSSQSSSKQASQSGKSDASDKSGNRRVIGEGMNSLDSTQVPLKAETGEPDWDAVKGNIPRDADQK